MLSVVIPALNEEQYLEATVLNVVDSAQRTGVKQLDIIVINDGSTDGTADVIRKLESRFPFVRSIHHPRNQGIGQSFIDALTIAKYDRITFFSGDNNAHRSTIDALFANFDKADVVISYFINTEARGRFRNLLSTVFSTIHVTFFDLHVKYINGNAVYPTELLRETQLNARGYSIYAEINVKLLRRGVTFLEVAGYSNPEATKSQAVRAKNLMNVMRSFLFLLYEVRVRDKTLYLKNPTRIDVPDFSSAEAGITSMNSQASRAVL
jgi:glycosyltransferase involved in cell wall biosynthesis